MNRRCYKERGIARKQDLFTSSKLYKLMGTDNFFGKNIDGF